MCCRLAEMSSLCPQAPSDHAAAEGPPGATVPFYDPAHFAQVSARAAARAGLGGGLARGSAMLLRAHPTRGLGRPPLRRVFRLLPLLPAPGVEACGGGGSEPGCPNADPACYRAPRAPRPCFGRLQLRWLLSLSLPSALVALCCLSPLPHGPCLYEFLNLPFS